MNLKKMITISVCVLSALALSVSAQARTTITIAHTHVETHPEHKAFLAFKNHIENNIEDKYDIQIYPNGLSGSNERVFELVKINSIQFMAISSSNIENLAKSYAIFSIPYLFNSEDVYEKFISDPEVLKELGKNSDKEGFVPLAVFTAGTRNFYAKFPIYSVDDLKDKVIRVQTGRTNSLMMEAFGANDYIMKFSDVYQALKHDVIDGAENNELALIDQKHGEFCKFYSYDGHQMIPDLLIGSRDFLKSLSDEEYAVFKEAAMEAQRVEFREWKYRINVAKEQAKTMGVNFINVDVNAFREKVLPLHDELLEKNPKIRELYEIAKKYY
jgi:tripartite ATP-independent transporter DctP family solute receptor